MNTFLDNRQGMLASGHAQDLRQPSFDASNENIKQGTDGVLDHIAWVDAQARAVTKLTTYHSIIKAIADQQ